MSSIPRRDPQVTLSQPEQAPGLSTGLQRAWRAWLPIGLILLLALALRLLRLDATSLWYDEGWSVHLARESLANALRQIGSEGHTHPPGYYLLLLGWVRAFGSSVRVVRGFSVLVGVLIVWAIYRLGGHLFDRRTGLAAALAAAIAPSYITYAQETRMYALLALACTWLLDLWYRLLYRPGSWRRQDWVALVVVETLAIYTHFISAVVLAGLGLWALWVLGKQAKQGDRGPLLRWLGSQALVALAFMPWLGISLQRAATHTAERATAPGLVSFVVQVWSFLLGGHIALYGREPLFRLIAIACLVAMAGLVAWLWLRGQTNRTPVAYLGAQTLMPLALVYAITQVRPGFHPRYVLMVLVPLLLLLARGLVRLAHGGWAGRAVAAGMALLWLGSTGLAARALWSDGYYVRDNARGAVAYLVDRLPRSAPVLIDNDDWAVRYYLEDRSLRIHYIDGGRPAAEVEAEVTAALMDPGRGANEARRAALIKWNQGETDRRGLLPFLLEQQGALAETHDLAGYSVWVYHVDDELPALAETQVDVRVGPLSLLRATVENGAPADEAVTIALTWRLERPVERDCKVALGLSDERGRRLASSDREIQNSRGMGTSRWSVGEEIVSYHTLRLPLGIAPLDYVPQVTVYDAANPSGYDVLDGAGAATGKILSLAPLPLSPARGRVEKQVDRAALGLRPVTGSASIAEGLELRAFGLDSDQARTGETISVALEWHSTASGLAEYRPALRLVRDGLTLAEEEQAPAQGRYPTSWWRARETVVEFRELLVPLDLESGVVELQIGVPGEASLSLGQIGVEKIVRSFEPPRSQVETTMSLDDVAELVGYDLSAKDLQAGAPLIITLYWRALGATASPHVVFVHLLNEAGQVIAQHDGAPAGGERPTTGWLAQEYVTDTHTLQWLAGNDSPQAGSQGPAMLEVGLYNPLNGNRLTTRQGDSRLILPTSIMVR